MLTRISTGLWWFGAIAIVVAGYIWLSGEARRQDCETALQADGKADAAYKPASIAYSADKSAGKSVVGGWSTATRVSAATPAAAERDRSVAACKPSAGLYPLDIGLILGLVLWAIAFVLDGALLPDSEPVD